MQRVLHVSRSPPGNGRTRNVYRSETQRLERLHHATDHPGAHGRVPHEPAAPYLLGTSLELRLDEHYSLAYARRSREEVRERDHERDKRQVSDHQIRAERQILAREI